MSKIIAGDGEPKPVPELQPPAEAEHPKPKRRPSKTRLQAWAKIDGGKGTWKPK